MRADEGGLWAGDTAPAPSEPLVELYYCSTRVHNSEVGGALSYRLGYLTNLIEVGKKSLLLHRVPSTKQCSPSGLPNGHNNSVTCILWQHLRSTRALQPPTCSATPATPLKVLSRCIHSRHNRCAAPASQSPICTYSARYASAPAPMQRTARHQMISTTLVRINIHNHHAYMG